MKGESAMEWNWLLGLVYGLFGGFFEFLPVPPQVHQSLLVKITGLSAPGNGLAFAVHLGGLLAVLVSYYGKLAKLLYEKKLAGKAPRARKRQPDVVCLMELRLLKTAVLPIILSCFAAAWLRRYFSTLWVLAIAAAINGILVLLPHYMSRGNKDARTISPLDAVLVGLGGMLGAIPGLSRVGMLNSVASMRGIDRGVALDFTYLLSIPALATLCVVDFGQLIMGEAAQTNMLLPGIFACIAAFGTGLAGIRLMHFLAKKTGYEGLAYYNWGLAMFTFIIYLIG